MQIKDKRIQLAKSTLVAFDLDGTLTTADFRSSWQAVHEFFGTWEAHGEPILQRFLRGEISYYEFDKADAEVWIGRSEDEYQEAIARIELREGARELVSFLKGRGCILVILSMGLKDIVEKIAIQLGFDYWLGNEIIRHNNQITGEVKINIGWKEKGNVLRTVLKHFKIHPQNSIAIGDSTADIDMFKVAGVSIAVEPSSERVAAAVDLVCQNSDLKEIISFFH
ncbi:MAG: HAD family hydrolase [Candidatus Hodarchaeales archaeon]|jgi:phosphoserine phosphatase